jgi:hypothetical protein
MEQTAQGAQVGGLVEERTWVDGEADNRANVPLDETQRRMGRPIRADTIATWIGFLEQRQALQLLAQEHILDLPPREALEELWERTALRCEDLAAPPKPEGAPATIGLLVEHEAEILERPTFLRDYAPYANFRVGLVPAHQLIPSQWFVNLDYVEALQARAPSPDDLEGGLAFAFAEGTELEDYWLTKGAIAIAMGAVGAPAISQPEGRRISPYTVEVVVRVQTRPNYLQVLKIGSRLVVANGTHRAAALMRAGWERIPCILSQARGMFEGMFERGGFGLIPEFRVVEHPRPPYLADCFDAETAPRFRQRSVFQVVRVTPQVDMMYVAER